MWDTKRLRSALVVGICSLIAGGCSGGSVNHDTIPPPTKAVYEGPEFGNDENGGLGYTNTNILVRPPDQNDGNKGRITGALSTDDLAGDGWYFDRYTFTAIESGSRNIQLQTSAFDPVLAVFRVYPDGFWEYLGYDDDSDGNKNARFTVNADRNAVYVVTVTSYAKGGAGNYTVLLSPGLTYATTRKMPVLDFASPHNKKK